MNDSTLIIDLLTKCYGGRQVLHVKGLQLSGGLTLLLGPNGSGKSTLLRVLCGLEHPTAGDVGYFAAPGPRIYIPARPARLLLPWYSVSDNFDFFSRVRAGVGPQPPNSRSACDFFDQFVPAGLRTLPVHTLSLGQQVRVALACALAARPRLMAIDEALSALDVSVRGGIVSWLAEHTTSSHLVIATHDHELISQAAASGTPSITLAAPEAVAS